MKVVIPAAGLGTRLLPITKAIPKEMLPLGNRPLIHHMLEEALKAGLTEIGIVIGKNKGIIKEYLSQDKYTDFLNGYSEYQVLEKLLTHLKIEWIYQKTPLGLGDALLCAKKFAGDEPFAVMLPDNICSTNVSVIGKLIDLFQKFKKPCLALRKVSDEESLNTGSFELETIDKDIFRIVDVYPKGVAPPKENLIRGVGRYVFTADVFLYLEEVKKRVNSEFDEVKALSVMSTRAGLLGLLVKDRIYHVSSKEGYVKVWQELNSCENTKGREK